MLGLMRYLNGTFGLVITNGVSRSIGGVSNAMKLPTPDRDDIFTWVHEAYDKISEESIWRTFQLIGFRCEEFE
jgi:hypothetical protein